MNHVIYIPGIGDHYDWLRKLALKRWRNSDTNVTFVPMRWSNRHETYEQKYQRIRAVIEEANGSNITLVGESAGGAMALLTFSRSQAETNQVITICGYNHGAGDVHQYHKYRHPAFYRLMPLVDRTIEDLDSKARRRITTFYSLNDRTVTPSHTRIKEATEIVVHASGHFASIAHVLIRKIPHL